MPPVDQGQLGLGGRAWVETCRQAASAGLDQGEQLGPQDMALAHVDDPVRHFRVEPDERRPAPTFNALSVARRRLFGGDRCGGRISVAALLGERGFDPRHEIAAIGLIVGMLELAAAAFGEMPAWRFLVMRAGRQRAVVEHASPGTPNGTWRPLGVTPSPRAAMRTIGSFIAERERLGNRFDEIVGDHLRPGDFGSAPVQPDGGAGCFERLQAPRAHRRNHSRKHVACPCARQPCRRRRRKASLPSGDATNVSGPL